MNNILDNEAIFEVYFDIPANEIDAYFNIEAGTYDSQKHTIICRLPVETQGFKASHRYVKLNTESIHCNDVFNEVV